MEALKSERHGQDYRKNSDFEDIVYLFNNRTTLLSDLLEADIKVKSYLKKEIKRFLTRPFIREEIEANLDFSNQTIRQKSVIDLWERLVH